MSLFSCMKPLSKEMYTSSYWCACELMASISWASYDSLVRPSLIVICLICLGSLVVSGTIWERILCVWLCVLMVRTVWGVSGVSLGNDPVGKEPKLLNLCIATPNFYSLSNRLSPSVFLSCFILYLLLFSSSFHPFHLAFFNRSWLL
jgi:hypothetical protein